MFGFLRLVRGICGLIFGMNILGFLLLPSRIQQPGRVTDLPELVLGKTIALIVFGVLFFALRNLINWMHTKKHGTPHPALVKKWGL